MEGGALQGMSLALGEEVIGDDRKVTSIDWSTLPHPVALIGFHSWEMRLQSAISGVLPRQKLRKLLVAYRDFALEDRRLFELMFLTRRTGVPAAPASLRATSSPAFSQVVSAVKQCMSTGSLLPGDVGETILLAWSTAHGLITLHFAGRFGYDNKVFRTVFERTIDQLFQALSRGHGRGR
jgi:hypothetical protein